MQPDRHCRSISEKLYRAVTSCILLGSDTLVCLRVNDCYLNSVESAIGLSCTEEPLLSRRHAGDGLFPCSFRSFCCTPVNRQAIHCYKMRIIDAASLRAFNARIVAYICHPCMLYIMLLTTQP